MRAAGVVAAAVLFLLACQPAATSLTAPTRATPSPIPVRTAATPAPTMSAERARAMAEAYLAAYNAGDLDAALALLAEDVTIADCDYASGTRVSLSGKAEVVRWLRQRFADHDRFEVQRMSVNPQDFTTGILYRQRTTDSLRAQGIEADTSLTGTVILFRGAEIVQINTADVTHCSRIVAR